MPRPTHPSKSLQRLHTAFLSILGKIEGHARYAFRHVRCYHTRQDLIAETVAISYAWFLRLAEQGKNATTFPGVLASYASRAVRSGRRLCRQESPKDTLSPTAHRRRGFVVTKLPDFSTESTNPLQEALIDNTQSPVPEQVAFRIDWPSWNKSQGTRRRMLIKAMVLGHRTNDLAQNFQLSPARISQLRRELERSWRSFIGELPALRRHVPLSAA